MATKKTTNNTGGGKKPRLGVYRIVNGSTGRMMIGSGPDPEMILARHKLDLLTRKHKIKELQDEFIAYMPESFTFDVVGYIKPCAKKDEAKTLAALEARWRRKYPDEIEREYRYEPD